MNEKLRPEKWADIKSHNDYKISNYGRVYSRKSKRILKPSTTTKGYLYVELYKDKISKTFPIQILVASEFVSKRPTISHQVNHKDKNKLNNYFKNLEWATNRENKVHGLLASGKFACSFDNRDKMFRPQIYINGISYSLGRYKTNDEAATAYMMGCIVFNIENKYLEHGR